MRQIPTAYPRACSLRFCPGIVHAEVGLPYLWFSKVDEISSPAA